MFLEVMLLCVISGSCIRCCLCRFYLRRSCRHLVAITDVDKKVRILIASKGIVAISNSIRIRPAVLESKHANRQTRPAQYAFRMHLFHGHRSHNS